MLAAVSCLLPLAASAAPFPTYPNGFSYDLAVTKDHAAAPSLFLTYSWDLDSQKSWYSVNNTELNTYELQLRRCDAGANFDIKGTLGSDPSTFSCTLGTICPVTPFWHYPGPGLATWNGTDTINGLECDRFDIKSGMGRQTFWGTPTTPCRAITNNGVYEQQDYSNWVPSAAPASFFDNPAYLDAASCKPVVGAAAIAASNATENGFF